jgi:LacI family transcriptional regulator
MNLKQLSLHLGLSQTTVSRALNGYSDVSEETRRRVEEAARRFDYTPNASARRLATGEAGAIGIVFPTGNNLLLDPLFTDFLSGLTDRAARAATDIVVSASIDDDEAGYRRLARKRSADVIILSSPLVADARVPLVHRLGLPCVVHGRTETDAPHAFLDIDNEGAFRRATELLIDLGHRRIGFVNGDRRQTYARDRERGWIGALEGRGLPAPDALLGSDLMTDEAGYRLTAGMLDGDAPPTAILASSIFSAIGACRAIRDRGLSIGADVSVIAHDDGINSIRPETHHPALTTTFSSIRKAGERIAEIAGELMAGRPAEDCREVWPVDLIFRDSTRPPPAGSL